MELINYSSSALSLIPSIIALSMAIITRHVLFSLATGIIFGALLLNSMQIVPTFMYMKDAFLSIFFDMSKDNVSLNLGKVNILLFLIILGIITSLLALSGGSVAFASWAQKRIKSKVGAQLLAAFLGVFIFVDDYFNSLTVGAISRPVTDRFKVSRAKLAYIVDSTAAPMCVIMPLSSWGAYIITVVAGLITLHGVEGMTPLTAFMKIIVLNFYAIFAILLVFIVIIFGLNVGPMETYERLALKDDKSRDGSSEVERSYEGKISYLIYPILVLVFSTVLFLIYTGAKSLSESGLPFSLFGAFENTDVGASLLYGGLLGLFTSIIPFFRQKNIKKEFLLAVKAGVKSMLPAIFMLIFAWTISIVISDMKTGKYLSTLVYGNLNPSYLPAILFLLSGFMAFSTGTSWGTFGIMLPIAADLAISSDVLLFVPMLAAVLAGAVFGDHCSPISDTTILSSTGTKCKHMDHVITQIPYSFIVALISVVGFLVVGITYSSTAGFFVCSIMFFLLVFFMKLYTNKKIEEI